MRNLVGMAAVLLAGCASGAGPTPLPPPASDNSAGATAHPEIWPQYSYPVHLSAAQDARIAELLARMTLDEKIGQLVQADLCCVTPDDIHRYHLGSILVGGNSGPHGDDLAPPADWLKAADEFYAASVDPRGGGVAIPVIWGIDAVHGHANIVGATIFPQNIGLGAANDPALIERIGAATATEIRATGQEWTFAPTVAVPQDYRWGRAYEGYSSDPQRVAAAAGAMIRGLQGPPGEANILAAGKVIASAKHFLADGGTKGGVDQGDADIGEAELRDIHGVPYGAVIQNGVATVMVSFSSWQGKKLTGNRSLITGVLKDRMGFGGFAVSDWNAHGQVEGCTNASCPQALLAGLDMYMAPDSWKAIYTDLLARATAGTIPMARINDAVRRILGVKMRLGLFEAGKPSSRSLSGRFELLGAPDHRAVAREAVRKSLVLLKNQGVLPLKPGGRLLVAGEGADDIARQSGGWTLSWQGTGLTNANFPGATSLWSGLRQAVEAAGGKAELAPDGRWTTKPDAAVVVFGEKPYAEFQGDRASLALDAELTGPYATMRKLKAEGIPVVAVMLTGRPLYVNPALNVADAFVAAWLPGSEGEGVADVLIGDAAGKPRFDFSGTLPAAWPRTPDMADGALFPLGYGLTYAARAGAWATLPEVAADTAADQHSWFAKGVPAASWSLVVAGPEGGEQTRVTTVPVQALGGRVTVTAADHRVQEGARRFVVTGGDAAIRLQRFETLDLSREANGDVLLLFTIQVAAAPARAELAVAAGDTIVGVPVALPAGAGFVRYGLPLKCLQAKGADLSQLTAPFVLRTSGAADISLAEVRVGTDAEQLLRCP